VNKRPHNIGAESGNLSGKILIKIDNLSVETLVDQGVCDATSGANRNITLMGEAASDNKDL
jgi:hypothetical protein